VIEFADGVNFFTGPNGAGKSLIGDAVFWGLYGESLRDGRKWKPQDGATVELETEDGSVIKREVRGSKTKLALDGLETGRITEIQDEITRRFGSAHYNKAVRFFHRAKAAKFALATDGERKAIIERLIGVDVFDDVLTRLKHERKDLVYRKDMVVRIVSKAQDRQSYCYGMLDSMKEPEKIDGTELMKLKKEAASIHTEKPEQPVPHNSLPEIRYRVEKSREAVAVAKHELRRLEELGTGVCSKCGNATGITNDAIYGAKESLEDALEDLAFFNKQLNKLEDQYDYDMNVYQFSMKRYTDSLREISVLNTRIEMLERKIAERDQEIAQYDRKKEAVLLDIEDSEKEIMQYRISEAGIADRLSRVNDLIVVFGPRGARVLALRDAFSSIAEVCTGVVQQIGYDERHRSARLNIELSEDLSTVDLIVTVGDYAGSYGGLSEGEGAIFDFGLLKALGTLPWRSTVGLPFVYDDVLEAMDVKHKQATCSYIDVEAVDDQVLLFSYDEEIIEMFSDPKVFHIEGGRVV